MSDSSQALKTIEEAIQQLPLDEIREATRMIEREEKRREREARKEAQQELKQVAQRYGFDLETLVEGGNTKGGRRQNKVAPKYKDPESGKTWTGRGRKPKWVEAWIAEGRDLEETRIRD